jgi:hypothetical protein
MSHRRRGARVRRDIDSRAGQFLCTKYGATLLGLYGSEKHGAPLIYDILPPRKKGDRDGRRNICHMQYLERQEPSKIMERLVRIPNTSSDPY